MPFDPTVQLESARRVLTPLRATDAQALLAIQSNRAGMHEAPSRFVAHLLDELRMRRLAAEIDPRNVPSAKVLERIGFQREGLLRGR